MFELLCISGRILTEVTDVVIRQSVIELQFSGWGLLLCIYVYIREIYIGENDFEANAIRRLLIFIKRSKSVGSVEKCEHIKFYIGLIRKENVISTVARLLNLACGSRDFSSNFTPTLNSFGKKRVK